MKCFNSGEYGHYVHDCPKPHDNANIAEGSEQNKKLENMMDFDNSSVCKECAMMCTEVHYEDGDEDLIVFGDQGVSTEERDKATYDKLMKTQSEEEEEVQYNVALCANNSVSLEKKRRQHNENMPNKHIHNVSQSDVSLSENPPGNTFNNKVTTVLGPMGDDDEIKSQKV